METCPYCGHSFPRVWESVWGYSDHVEIPCPKCGRGIAIPADLILCRPPSDRERLLLEELETYIRKRHDEVAVIMHDPEFSEEQRRTRRSAYYIYGDLLRRIEQIKPCAPAIAGETGGATLRIPEGLEEEFSTFLEIGLASVTAFPDEELTPNERRLVQFLKGVVNENNT